MKTGSWKIFFVAVCLTLTIFACSPVSPAQAPGAVTPAPVLQDPTSAVAAPVEGDLSESEILQIVRSSLSTYPWRLEQNILAKGAGQNSLSLTEAQSSTRGHSLSAQNVGTETVTIESVLFDTKFYLKIIGSPAETYGLVSGHWTEVLPGSPMAQFVDRSAIDLEKLVETFAADLAAVSGESGGHEMLFNLIGPEEVDGILTNVYESKGATYNYRWWIGPDQRFYKTTVDIPEATRTIIMEYDPGINIQPPIP